MSNKVMTKRNLRENSERRQKYDKIHEYQSNGLAIVELKGLKGIINEKGEEIVKPIYDDISIFSEGIAKIKKLQFYGFIDEDGKELFEPNFHEIEEFDEKGIAKIIRYYRKGRKYAKAVGYVNRKGELLLEPKYYDEIKQFPINDKFFLISPIYEEGSVVINDMKEIVSYDKCFSKLDNNTVLIEDVKTKLYGTLDKNLDFAIRPMYDRLETIQDENFQEKLIGIEKKNYYLVEKNGERKKINPLGLENCQYYEDEKKKLPVENSNWYIIGEEIFKASKIEKIGDKNAYWVYRENKKMLFLDYGKGFYITNEYESSDIELYKSFSGKKEKWENFDVYITKKENLNGIILAIYGDEIFEVVGYTKEKKIIHMLEDELDYIYGLEHEVKEKPNGLKWARAARERFGRFEGDANRFKYKNSIFD